MNASELRLRARQSLSGNYWPAVLAALIASFFGALVSTGGMSFNFDIDLEVMQYLPSIVNIILIVLSSIAGMLALVSFILGGVVQLGYSLYLLKQHDGEITSVKELFSQFDRFGQGFLQMLLRSLFIFLWTLLLVIPGLIKSYAYAMTPFIMAENPDMTAREAITMSKQMMRGHKWELFCMSLSFIGWVLLSCLTMGIGFFFLAPYINAAYAAFYRDKIAPKAQSAAYAAIDAQPVL